MAEQFSKKKANASGVSISKSEAAVVSSIAGVATGALVMYGYNKIRGKNRGNYESIGDLNEWSGSTLGYRSGSGRRGSSLN